MGHEACDDRGKIVFRNVGRDFHDHRAARLALGLEFGAGGVEAGEQFVECGGGLQIAEPRRVGGRNVDREVAGKVIEGLEALDVVARPVARVFVGADVDADNSASTFAGFEAAKRRCVTAVVEA